MNQLNLGQMNWILETFRKTKKITNKNINGEIEDNVKLYINYLGHFDMEYTKDKKYAFVVDRSYFEFDTIEEAEANFLLYLIDYLGQEIIEELEQIK